MLRYKGWMLSCSMKCLYRTLIWFVSPIFLQCMRMCVFFILCECVNWRVYSNKTIIRIAVICARNRNLTKGSLIYLCSALSFAPISSKFIHISFSTYFIMVYVHVKAQTANTRVGHIHFNIKT